ncbi:MAG: ASPIC/UnbV domain-containing protein, partial [Acidobacteriota bacterium]|nr:ASPIC/UnbV domain-containing protein [Acidobacteriota bacterium]
ARVASSRCVLPDDIDGDGDLDLLVTQHNDVPTLIRNDLARGHWLQVAVRGSRSPRDGIGSRVEVQLAGEAHPRVRWIRRDASYLSSRRPVAHFGLGEHDAIERLSVYWTSGSVTTLDGPEVDRRLLVAEDTGEVESNSP